MRRKILNFVRNNFDIFFQKFFNWISCENKQYFLNNFTQKLKNVHLYWIQNLFCICKKKNNSRNIEKWRVSRSFFLCLICYFTIYKFKTVSEFNISVHILAFVWNYSKKILFNLLFLTIVSLISQKLPDDRTQKNVLTSKYTIKSRTYRYYGSTLNYLESLNCS